MQGNQEAYNNYIRSGHHFAWEQEWESALKAYELALRARPDDYTALTCIGLVYLQMNCLADALAVYQQAHTTSRNSLGALGRIAYIHAEMGQQREAAQSYMQIAKTYLAQNRRQKAVQSLLLAAELRPTLVECRTLLARCYESLNAPDVAANEWVAVAYILQKMQKSQSAKTALAYAKRLAPDARNVLLADNALQNAADQMPFPRVSRSFKHHTDHRNFSSAFGSLQEIMQLQKQTKLPQSPLQRIVRQALGKLSDIVLELNTSDTLPLEGPSDNSLNKRVVSLLQAMSLSDGIQAYFEQDFSNSEIAFDKARRAGADYPSLAVVLGDVFLRLKQFDDAWENFRSLSDFKSIQIGVDYGLAKSAVERGETVEGLRRGLSVLMQLDLQTIPEANRTALTQTYKQGLEEFVLKSTAAQLKETTYSILEFLSGDVWLHRLQTWRGRLDEQFSERSTSMPIACLFIPFR